MQTHTLILWSQASNDNFKNTMEKAFLILVALKGSGSELSPNFLTARRKAEAKSFEFSYENLEQLMKKSVNTEGGNAFPDLGYRISFFSSLDEESSSKISLTLGTSNPQLKNSLVVNLPQNLPLYGDEIIGQKVSNLFKELCLIFNPYWGCIQNEANTNRLDDLWEKSLPTSIHWVNFFGQDIVRVLGAEKIERAPVSEVQILSEGYFLKMKDTPIDECNFEDIKIQDNINMYFGLRSKN